MHKREEELGLSIHLSLLPDCGLNIGIAELTELSLLTHVGSSTGIEIPDMQGHTKLPPSQWPLSAFLFHEFKI